MGPGNHVLDRVQILQGEGAVFGKKWRPVVIHFLSTFIAVSSSHLIAASSTEWSCSKPSSANFVSG